MALRNVPGAGQSYHLISFDKRGVEQTDDDGTFGSRAAIADVTATPDDATDVFILSHGWHGDYDAAIRQYDQWIRAAASDRPNDDIRQIAIGLHWPSKAWSDRPLKGAPSGLLGDDGPDDAMTVEDAVDEFAAHVAETDAARTALATILDYAASIDPEIDAAGSDELPSEVIEAYRILAAEADAASDDDPLLGAEWDPRQVFAEAAEHGGDSGDGDGLLGGGFWGNLREAVLTPLRQLTFWTMKDRARSFGESGGSALLRQIQQAAPNARVHLMGHSFGTIVVAATVRGPGTTPSPPLRPVESLFLVQGAVSLWAFASKVPESVGGGRGYFADVTRPEFVAGPLIATRSKWDYAVGRYYPLAVRIAGQYLLGESQKTPKYGAIGAFGVQGDGVEELDALATGVRSVGPFAPSRIYNVDASAVVARVNGLEGAHNDIAHRELSSIAWEAARWRMHDGITAPTGP